MKQIKKGFILRQVCGENVIVGEGLDAINFGKLLSLNETAAWLWQQAAEMGSFDVETLTDKLCEEYEVERQQATADVSAMLDKWQEVGVIEDAA